jgi:hypothetical protein
MAIRKDWAPSRIREFAGMGMDLNATNRDGMSPLFLAFSLRREDLVRVLLELGASEFRCTDLSTQPGSVDSLVLIRDSGKVNPEHLARYAHVVLFHNNVAQLSCLLEGCAVNAELARMDAEAERRGGTRLSPIYHCSCFIRRDDTLSLVLRSGCRDLGCDDKGRNAIHMLAARGRTSCIRDLADHDRERLVRAINQPAFGDDDNTPLHKCTSVKTCLELLRYGADPRALNRDGEACEGAWPSMAGGVQLLMADGVRDRAGEIFRKFIEDNKDDMMDPDVADCGSFPAVAIVNLVEARVRGLIPSPEDVDKLLTRMLGMKANRLGRVLQVAASSHRQLGDAEGGRRELRAAIFQHVLNLRSRYHVAIRVEDFICFHSDMSVLDADMAEALVRCVGPAILFMRQPFSSPVIRALESPEMLRRMCLYRSGELVTTDDAAFLYSRTPSRAIPDPVAFFKEHFSNRLEAIGVALSFRMNDMGEGTLITFLRDFANLLNYERMAMDTSLVRRLAVIKEPQFSKCLEVLPDRGNIPSETPLRRVHVQVVGAGAGAGAGEWDGTEKTLIERIWEETYSCNPGAKAVLLRNSIKPLCPIEDVIFHVHPEGSWWELLNSMYPPAHVCTYMHALEQRGEGLPVLPGPKNMCPTLYVPNFFSLNPRFPLVRNARELWIALRYCFPDVSRAQALRLLINRKHVEPRRVYPGESLVHTCCALFASEVAREVKVATLTSLDAETVIRRPYQRYLQACSPIRKAWDQAKIGKGEVTWRVWNRIVRAWTGAPLDYLRDDFWELDGWALNGPPQNLTFRLRANPRTHT